MQRKHSFISLVSIVLVLLLSAPGLFASTPTTTLKGFLQTLGNGHDENGKNQSEFDSAGLLTLDISNLVSEAVAVQSSPLGDPSESNAADSENSGSNPIHFDFTRTVDGTIRSIGWIPIALAVLDTLPFDLTANVTIQRVLADTKKQFTAVIEVSGGGIAQNATNGNGNSQGKGNANGKNDSAENSVSDEGSTAQVGTDESTGIDLFTDSPEIDLGDSGQSAHETLDSGTYLLSLHVLTQSHGGDDPPVKCEPNPPTIPEPSSAIFVLGGALLFSSIRRRKE